MKNRKTIKKMTLEQKALLMSGKNMWETVDFPSLKIPSIFFADGPYGLRKQVGAADHLGLNESLPATSFPTSASVANSWDLDLIKGMGKRIGVEASYHEVDALLGPGLNIKRNPKCGRNFEYYSEDPFVSGKMAASFILGLQSTGTMATPKHLAVNSQETIRMSSDSIIDERTYREIYLTGFEIAVKEGKPESIMSSYNKINGIYAHENNELLKEILVKEWGFEGIVISDWGGSNNHVKSVENGAHLAMPTVGYDGQQEIVNAVLHGVLSEDILNQRVDELLSIVMKQKDKRRNKKLDFDEHALYARKLAAESTVLLKNDDSILPLTKYEKVVILGDFAETPRFQGAGSSIVNAVEVVNTLCAVKDQPINFVGFSKGYRRDGRVDKELIDDAVKLAKSADKVLVYLGLNEQGESEGMDREHLKIPNNQINLLQQVVKANENVVVILSSGSVLETPWDKDIKGLVHSYLSGQNGAAGILDVLCGTVNPSGKLTESYPHNYNDVPLSTNYPSKEEQVKYIEAHYVGYRYYDKINKMVKYPFGFGLSYTKFDYSNLEVRESGISIDITNIGAMAGSEVVQMYIGNESSSLPRAKKELKGFAKVYLEPNETKTITMEFDEYSFRIYDVKAKSWVIEAGTYKIYLGSSSSDIRCETLIKQKGVILEKLENIDNYYSGNIDKITDVEFETLYGREITSVDYADRKTIDINDPIKCIEFSKNVFIRFIYRIMNSILVKSQKKGKPNLNILFIYNMPFRAIAKMTNGMVTMDMVDSLVVSINGKFFKGIKGFIVGFFQNRKNIKQVKRLGDTNE